MGKLIKLLCAQKIGFKTIFSKRISIESIDEGSCFHIHYRNIRLEFDERSFKIFADSFMNAYKRYKKGTGKVLPGQTFLEHNANINEGEVLNGDEIKIELCENLYKAHKNSIFGQYADYFQDNLYIHIHYRDIRLEFPISEFEIFVKSLMHSYINNSQQGNIFSSLKAMFDSLNRNEVNYLVMRNWDEILNNSLETEHPDIDLLIAPEEIPKFDKILNSTFTNLETYRVQRKVLVKIEGKTQAIFIDVRTTTDNYYPFELSEQTLSSRVLQKSIYIPSEKYHFLTLLYHMHYHKPKIIEKYVETLRQIYDVRWFDFNIDKVRNSTYVTDFFYKIGLKIIEPYDKSVYFNAPRVE